MAIKGDIRGSVLCETLLVVMLAALLLAAIPALNRAFERRKDAIEKLRNAQVVRLQSRL